MQLLMSRLFVCLTIIVSRVVVAPMASASDEPVAPRVEVVVLDESGQPVEGVRVGNDRWQLEPKLDGFGNPPRGTLVVWSGTGDEGLPAITDEQGQAQLSVPANLVGSGRPWSVYALDPLGGRVGLASIELNEDRKPDAEPLAVRLVPACRVHARLLAEGKPTPQLLLNVSTHLRSASNPRFLSVSAVERPVEFWLPPGEYELRAEGRLIDDAMKPDMGLPMNPLRHEFTVTSGQRSLNLGRLAMSISAQGRMVGEPAPLLGPAIAWLNSSPLTLEQLHGKFVLLVFFTRGCGACSGDVALADLLRDRYAERGFEVIAVHTPDELIQSADDFLREYQPWIEQAAESLAEGGSKDDPRPINLPIMLEAGDGLGQTMQEYHATGWPSAVLIGRDGRVLRHYGGSMNYFDLKSLLEQHERARVQ